MDSKEYHSNWYRTPIAKVYPAIDPMIAMFTFLLNKNAIEGDDALQQKMNYYFSQPDTRFVSNGEFKGLEEGTGAEKWTVKTRIYDKASRYDDEFETNELSRGAMLQVLAAMHEENVTTRQYYNPGQNVYLPHRQPIERIVNFEMKYGNAPFLVTTQTALLPKICYLKFDEEKTESTIRPVTEIRDHAENYLAQFEDNKKELMAIMLKQDLLSDMDYLLAVPPAMKYIAIRAGRLGSHIYRLYGFMPNEMLPVTKGPEPSDAYFAYEEMRYAIAALDYANMQPIMTQNSEALARQKNPLMNHTRWTKNGGAMLMGPFTNGPQLN